MGKGTEANNEANNAAREWKQAIGELQLQVTPDIFEMYLQPLRLLGVDGDVFSLAAPNGFVKDWLDLRLSRAVLKTLRHIRNRPTTFEVTVVDPVQLAQAAVVSRNEAGGWTLVQAGKVRDAGFVRLWHDLRNFYGPRIGLDGVGLWAELRAQVHEGGAHPLDGYAWPGYRGIAEAYGMTRDQVGPRVDKLKDVGLVEWVTGRELMDLWQSAESLPRNQRPGIEPAILRRLLNNADASRLYTVHDPLELPAFCVAFGLALERGDEGRIGFDSYTGRVSTRWQKWLTNILDVRQVERVEPMDWKAWGLYGSF
ncbi:MAG: hypothetical protein KDE45_25020 [Caldilineaceae bacterium]|nr:hypothetical protein [Caldilineaceae bacterium]